MLQIREQMVRPEPVAFVAVCCPWEGTAVSPPHRVILVMTWAFARLRPGIFLPAHRPIRRTRSGCGAGLAEGQLQAGVKVASRGRCRAVQREQLDAGAGKRCRKVGHEGFEVFGAPLQGELEPTRPSRCCRQLFAAQPAHLVALCEREQARQFLPLSRVLLLSCRFDGHPASRRAHQRHRQAARQAEQAQPTGPAQVFTPGLQAAPQRSGDPSGGGRG